LLILVFVIKFVYY